MAQYGHTATVTKPTAKPLIEKDAKDARTGVVPKEGTPPTQLLPLFIGGMLVAAELHDLPAPIPTDPPVPGYKMYSSASGYVWVPKAEGDAMFAPADELDPMIVSQALSQGLRVAVPEPPVGGTTTTTAAPTTTMAMR
jgi:hypothetical protein